MGLLLTSETLRRQGLGSGFYIVLCMVVHVKVCVNCRSTLAHSLICKAVSVYAKCVLCALLQWESNSFINPLCNLVNARVLGPCELAGGTRIGFHKTHPHTFSHALSKRQHIQTLEWGLPWRLAHSTETVFSHNPKHGIVKLGNTCLHNIYSHIYLSTHKPLHCKALWKHHLLKPCTCHRKTC